MSTWDRELRVGGIFRIVRKIGSGSFGSIYMGTHLRTGANVAIKIEHLKSKPPQLAHEYKIYRVLAGGVGIPKIH